ncbi:DNA methyltransferase [Brevibacterium aurantiacum]|uniref:adenine-specific methyltransferase EcoRI family protein n=1 Tax=Brevibacterium aurantiacum TaxID=273384 RepID=UPI000DF42497|nr:adenine-specific methyltransferase EcoRI family protein [Brevibacterium aurantiacum]RCS91858.1 DNA methyltransferase [Brevibacterium aurantiacum]
MASNSLLGTAKTAKKDEFYTQWADIEREMNAYLEYDPDAFRDKTILLPCDDPEWSNFTKFFALHFAEYGLKKLVSTSYAPNSNAGGVFYEPTLFELDDPDYDAEKSMERGRVFTLTREDVSGNGRVDIDDLRWEYLEGDGDFRSPEVTALRNDADMVITNGPFSLFREFIVWLAKANVQFSIIGNMNAITYREVFPLIQENRLWLGPTISSGDREFRVPESYPLSAAGFRVDDDGKKYIRVKGVRWFTNIEHGRRHEPLPLMDMADNLKFNKKLIDKLEGHPTYFRYDNYDALEIPYTSAIPSDYEGIMGVPITWLDKYSPEQFEILGRGEDIEWARSNECSFFTPTTPELQALYRKRDKTWRIQNQYVLDDEGHAHTIYKRIFIRHRNPAPKES